MVAAFGCFGFALSVGVMAAANAADVSGSVVAEAEALLGQHADYLAVRAVEYEHGEGVAKDPLRAAALYCEAARLGHVEAMHALGWMYANGRGVERDDDYAGTLFAMAAYLGHRQAGAMLTHTGDYSGRVPDCLLPPPDYSLDPEWNPEEHIARLGDGRRTLARLVVALAPDYRVSPRLALAVAMTESGLDARAISPRNAMGIMQLIPDTALRFNVRDPFDARENVRGGLAYLRWLLAYFRGDVALVAAGYNAGERAVERYRGVPPYPETRDYVRRILEFTNRRQYPYDPEVTEPSALLPEIEAVAARKERL